jgi:16S rRNA (cytidine1402-2'-O)-methyltransferase
MTLQPAHLPAGLYLVAVPIGNLRDFSQRALETLAAVDLVLCEDTRMTGKLLQAHGVKAKLEIYNDHSADRARPKVLEALASGKRIALVSDAGTPLISDPGFKLVRDAQDLGLYVTSIPGANAVLTALQLSGLPTDKFSFLGFLPPKKKARSDVLREWADVRSTLVVYETAPRLIESLSDMAEVLGPREAAVVRELTKMYEEARRDTLPNLVTYYKEAGEPRGEIVIVIAPPGEKAVSEADIEAMLRDALKNNSVKDAAAHVAEMTGIPRKRAYEFAIMLTKGDKGA